MWMLERERKVEINLDGKHQIEIRKIKIKREGQKIERKRKTKASQGKRERTED